MSKSDISIYDKIASLMKQARTEKSHQYVATVLAEAGIELIKRDNEIKRLRRAINIHLNNPENCKGLRRALEGE